MILLERNPDELPTTCVYYDGDGDGGVGGGDVCGGGECFETVNQENAFGDGGGVYGGNTTGDGGWEFRPIVMSFEHIAMNLALNVQWRRR